MSLFWQCWSVSTEQSALNLDHSTLIFSFIVHQKILQRRYYLTLLCFYSLVMPSPGFSMLYTLLNVTRVKKQVKFTELTSKKSIPQRPSQQSTSITNNDDTDYSPPIKDNQQTTSHNVLNNILTCDFQRASL